jgi:carboxylesterase type B
MTNLITADVGNFGKVKGFTIGNVAEFRGVPFATIPARFRRAEKVTSLSEGTFDATKYGPYPAQPPEDEAGEVFLFGPYCENFHAEERKRKMSEDDCLNVNIVTPKDAVGTKKLPVVAWIYGIILKSSLKKGGAFCIGGNSKGIYNGTALVEESLKLNEPVVYVGINYRLNFFGFLASKELAKDNAKHGGGAGNYGISSSKGIDIIRDPRSTSCAGMDSGEY